MMERLFDDIPVQGTPDDLFELLGSVVDVPALYLACGTEDVLIDDNRSFEKACADEGISITVDFGPGRHSWEYWDRTIQDVLNWLPLPGAVTRTGAASR